MTTAEFTLFLEGRVAEWYRHEKSGWHGRRIGILEYLDMTADEYASWVLTGIADSRVQRVWDK